jgi:hypothetical protein
MMIKNLDLGARVFFVTRVLFSFYSFLREEGRLGAALEFFSWNVSRASILYHGFKSRNPSVRPYATSLPQFCGQKKRCLKWEDASCHCRTYCWVKKPRVKQILRWSDHQVRNFYRQSRRLGGCYAIFGKRSLIPAPRGYGWDIVTDRLSLRKAKTGEGRTARWRGMRGYFTMLFEKS